MMHPEIKLIIADDHPIFRRGLRAVIETDPQIKVMAEAGEGDTALACIRQYAPHIAILDLDMPGKDGFEVTRAIREDNLLVEVIILTMHDKESLLKAALDLGVKGFVLKDSAMPEIIDCIKAVMSGRNYVSPQLSSYLIGRGQRRAALAQDTPALKHLTPTEQNVLKLIAGENTSRQIADTLHISIRTVDRHRANICEKLNLHGSNALMKFAVSHKSEL
jgi:DNA-binding NarL/FixJ family response regulator